MKKLIIWYFAFALSFFAFFSSGFVDSQDGFTYLTIARRIYYNHTFEFPKEIYRETDAVPENLHLGYAVGRNGKLYSEVGIGYSLAMIPAVFAEDVFLHLSKTPPISAFPLNNDWPVLLFASFINAIFGAMLAVVLFIYLRSYGIKSSTSLFLSFVSIVTTNLFVYTKHVFPHMMFISFLVLSFYLIKKYSLTKNPKLLILAGLSYGITVISYNPTFVFPALPIVIYYLLLTPPKLKWDSLKIILRDSFYGLTGILPFIVIYLYYNWYRFGVSCIGGYTGQVIPSYLTPYEIVEGIWNTLFSPGRSFFLYSPLIITIFLFWHKLKKSLLPEIISFSLLFLIYVYFIGTLLGGPDYLLWHGEFSWGPRYLAPVIPFAMILVSNIFVAMKRYTKVFVFLPLALLGLYFEVLGVLLPYQLKFAGLEWETRIGGAYFTQADFGNMVPRFSPLFKMSKTLVKRIKNIGNVYDHGAYNLKLLDGFEAPFDLGWSVWRGVMPFSVIKFDNNSNNPIVKIGLQFVNHQIDSKSQYPLQLNFNLNGKKISYNLVILIGKEKDVTIDSTTIPFVPLDNILTIEAKYVGTDSAKLKNKQVPFLQVFRVNDSPQNIQTIDYPYVSEVSQNLYGESYLFWGGRDKDLWDYWDMHSRVYEQTFDLWWLRPFHYWDFPKNFFYTLLFINLVVLGTSLRMVIRLMKRKE